MKQFYKIQWNIKCSTNVEERKMIYFQALFYKKLEKQKFWEDGKRGSKFRLFLNLLINTGGVAKPKWQR